MEYEVSQSTTAVMLQAKRILIASEFPSVIDVTGVLLLLAVW